MSNLLQVKKRLVTIMPDYNPTIFIYYLYNHQYIVNYN